MKFGTWLDKDGHWFDTVHFPQITRAFSLRGPGCYLIKGKVINDFGFISIDVKSTERLATQNMNQSSIRLDPSKTIFYPPKQLKKLND